MKIKELMEILKEFEPDAEVYISGGDGDFAISHAKKDENGDCVLT